MRCGTRPAKLRQFLRFLTVVALVDVVFGYYAFGVDEFAMQLLGVQCGAALVGLLAIIWLLSRRIDQLEK